MTQALSAVVIAAVIGGCWLLGRPRPKLLRNTDASQVAALNRGQMERVLATDAEAPVEAANPPRPQQPASWPRDGRSRRALLAQLERQFLAGGHQRRQAMELCRAWRHPSALPLIRRGLRDADTSVVAVAAEAMTAFRGRTSSGRSIPGPAQAARLPRNVSRTR
jgi:hypothetical protein